VSQATTIDGPSGSMVTASGNRSRPNPLNLAPRDAGEMGSDSDPDVSVNNAKDFGLYRPPRMHAAPFQVFFFSFLLLLLLFRAFYSPLKC
jgi:hypothetical protein